jgi:hypothetical protein
LVSIVSLFLGIAGLALIAFMAIRDHAKQLASRRSLLGECAGLLERGTINHGGDGFPSLDGRHHGRRVHAECIPDTMTIRRLPQLWLSVSRIEPRPEYPEFAILVRPSGTEFYSLTATYPRRLDLPSGLPAEALVRGSGIAAQAHLDRAAPVLGKILAEPKVKEVGVTKKGLRIVWQACEGRRGEHLILRQCVFDGARVTRADLARLLSYFDELSLAVTDTAELDAA